PSLYVILCSVRPLFLSLIALQPRSTLFPYTTLFRSQKAQWLEPLLRGEITSSFSLTEPQFSGSDPTMINTRAERDGDEYVINGQDRKSTRLNSSHQIISYAVFCLKKKKKQLYNTK